MPESRMDAVSQLIWRGWARNRRVIERALEASVFLSLGLVVGLVFPNLVAVALSLSDSGLPPYRALAILLMGNVNIWTIGGGTLVGVLLMLYLWTVDRSLTLRFNPSALVNGLVFICGASLVLPPIPVRLVALLLLVTVVLFVRTQPMPGRLRGFWVLVLTFFILNALGIATAMLGINGVRAFIPIQKQVAGMMPFVTAFIIYYAIRRSEWQVREFEILFRIIMIGGLFLAMEALATFYIGRPALPFLGELSVNTAGMFISGFFTNEGSVHHVSRIGMTTLFISLYFYYRSSQPKYVLSAGLGLLLVLATLNRMVILSSVIGLVILIAFARRNRVLPRATVMMRRVGAAIVLVAGIAAYVLLFQQVTEIRNAHTLERSVRNRIIHLARAADVIAYTPLLGTGPGLDRVYLGSSLVTTVVFDPVTEFMEEDRTYALSRVVRDGLTLEQGEPGYSTHNLWIQFVMQWGIAGLVLIVYLLGQAWKVFAQLRGTTGVDTRPAWALFSFAISLSFSMLTTVKFDFYWYFALVFAFVSRGVSELVEKQSS